ncbi:MAG TPA: hypothetical protein VEX13_01205 [Chloroflexia bacterium]|nr:hypothetical protein [Chloroflexia bacterium]
MPPSQQPPPGPEPEEPSRNLDKEAELRVRASMPAQGPESPDEVGLVRKLAIERLCDVIYGRLAGKEASNAAGAPLRKLEHDPGLLRRTEAVELLGRFSEPEAATALANIVVRGEKTIPGPTGAWLRDSALLSLVSSKRLRTRDVNRGVRRIYKITRHLRFWTWSRVYDDLPLLARYHKLPVFFLAFWLLPILVLAIPTLLLVWQFVDRNFYARMERFITSLNVRIDLFGHSLVDIVNILITVGSAMEIYLIHQVVVAAAASLGGPLIRLPGGTGVRWRMSVALAFLAVTSWLLWQGESIRQSECYKMFNTFDGSNPCADTLWRINYILPLLLLPMYILAHDLEQSVRYEQARTGLFTRAESFLLRRITDIFYLMILLFLSASVWTTGSLREVVLPYMAYLFAVPFAFIAILKFISWGLVWLRATARNRGSGGRTDGPPDSAAHSRKEVR